jgi:RNA polymerase sigma-70 factor (ECF subfamily)
VPTEQEQFERIAMPHLAALLRVARRLAFEPTSAEDLVQETMLHAWRGFQGFEPGTNARAWLFRILFNAFYGEGRRAQRAQEWNAQQRAVAHPPAPTVVDAKVQEAVEIAEALQALPIEQRTVLLLCVVEGFTCQEAAGILNVPIGTVMSRLSRARQEMRTRLAPLAKEAYR